MNNLHTEWMPAKGGQAKRVLQDLQIIRELGYKPFLACKEESYIYKEAIQKDFDVFPVEFDQIFRPSVYTNLATIIRRHKINIIHTHSSKDSYPATYIGKLLGCKIVRSRHIDLNNKPGHIYRMADAIVTTGENIRKKMIQYGIQEKKIFSIPTYPDINVFHPSQKYREKFRKELEISSSQLVIGTLTGTIYRKRPLLLIEIIKELVQKYPNILLLIAGESKQKGLKDIEHSISKLKLEENVRFIGYVTPELFLNAIDLYACPSAKEGLPQALMQAMATGKPCVSTDVGSVFELNLNNNLLIVEKDDKRMFVQALESLIQSEESRARLGMMNFELIKNNFSYDVMKENTRLVYEKVLSQ